MYNCIIVSRFFYDFSNISNRCWNFRWKNIRKISNRKREREKNKFRYIWKNEIDVYFTKKCKFFLFKIGNDVWRRTMKLEYCPRQKECSISLEFYWWNNLSENFVSKMNDRKKKKKIISKMNTYAFHRSIRLEKSNVSNPIEFRIS